MNNVKAVPSHVGFIMDGNGRWAKSRKLSHYKGHEAGGARMFGLLRHSFEIGVKTVTCYVLSTENLKRDASEVKGVFLLVSIAIKIFIELSDEFHVKIKFAGDMHALSPRLVKALHKVEEHSLQYEAEGKCIYVCLAYGSRNEIVRAANKALQKGEMLTEESLLASLDAPINLDLVIRPGGEHRLSNFMLYQCTYAEIYFSDVLFPDFSDEEYDKALEWYASRKRNFGLRKDTATKPNN